MGGKSSTISTSEQRILSLQVQQSSQGLTVPVVYGRTRIAGNLIWYGDFTAIEHRTETTQGGKGGGGGMKQVDIKYTYEAAVAMALCEGNIKGIVAVWRDKEKFSRLADLGLTLKNGEYSQSVWSHLQAKHPAQAIAYSDTAYVYGAAYQLTNTAQVYNHNFEVDGKLGYSSSIVDANPRDIIVDLLTNKNYGCGFPAENLGDTEVYSTYCRALGLFLSPAYSEQNEAQQNITELLEQTNSAAVFSQGRLKLVPYGDSPVYGNGAAYIPNLTPLYHLTDDDFIVSGAEDPVKCERKTPADAYNQVQIEYLNRANDYNIAIAEAKDQANIEQFGLRPKDAVQMHGICDKNVAQQVAQLLLQRGLYVRNEYEFKLGWKYILLEPMDLVTLTDAGLGLDNTPVRIIEVEEDEDGTLTIRAEDFPFGIATAPAYPTQNSSGYSANYNISPENAFTPVIFEAPLNLTNNAPQIWLATAGGENWGGCEVWISTDGDSYVRAGTINQKSRYGTLTAQLPNGGVVYDRINAAAVHIVAGSLQSVPEQDARDMLTPCYVGGEFISYTNADLTGLGQYRLSNLMRGAWGSNIDTHDAGTPFVRIDNSLFKYSVNKNWLGKTVWVKLVSFNLYGSALQELSEVPAYSYMLVGAPLGQITNLRLTSEWAWGKHCVIAWDKLDGAESYDVEVYAADSQTRLRSSQGILDNQYQYAQSDMLADGGQVRNIVFKVRGRAVTGKTGAWTQIIAQNPQLKALQGIELESGLKQAFFTCTTPQEEDFAGIILWVSDEPTCPTIEENKVYDGADTFVTITKCKGKQLEGGKTYYIRAAGYDSFDKNGLNISSSHAFTVYEVNEIAKELSESNLAKSLKSRIDLVDGSGAGSVNERLQKEATARAAAITAETNARITAIRAEATARANAITAAANTQAANLRTEVGKLNTAIQAASTTAQANLTAKAAELTAKDNELKAQADNLLSQANDLATQARQLGVKITAVERVNAEQAQQISTVTTAQGATAAALEEERTARASGDVAEAQARQTLATEVGKNKAAIAAESKARADGDKAEAAARTTLATRIGQAETAINTERTTRTNADTAQTKAREALAAELTNTKAALEVERTARADGDRAEAQARDALAARLGAAESAIGTERTARTNADNAQTQEINAAKARLGTAEANIGTLQRTTAETNRALATAQQTLTAKIDGIEIGGRNYFKKTTTLASLRTGGTIQHNALNGINITTSNSNHLIFRLNRVIDAVGIWTVSMDIKCATGTHNVFVDVNDEGRRQFAVTTEFKRISLTVATTRFTNNVYHFVDIETNSAAAFEIKDLKIEKGNQATDWTPAPEDINAATAAVVAELTAFKQAQATTDAAQTRELNTAKSQIAGHTSEISTLKTTKADSGQVVTLARTGLQAEWRGYTDTAKRDAAIDAQRKADAARTAAEQTAQTKAREAQQAAERAAQTKADAAKSAAIAAASGDATGKANAAKAAAIADAAAKDAVVKQDAATDAQRKADAAKTAAISEAQRLNTATDAKITTLQQTVSNDRQAAATRHDSLSARVDNLQVGGRNYLRSTGDLSNRAFWRFARNSNQTAVEPARNVDTLTLTAETANWVQYVQRFNENPLLAELEVGEVYTLSFEAHCSVAVADFIRIFIRQYYAGGSSNTTRFITPSRVNEWLKYSYTFTVPARADGFTGNHIVLEIAQIGTIKFRKIKLERGNFATDWTPAIEDVNDAVAGVQAVLDSHKFAQATADAAQTAEINKAKSQIHTHKSAIENIRTTKADKTEVASLARTTLQSEWKSYTDTAKSAAAAHAQQKADAAKASAIAAADTAAKAKADAAKTAAIAAASDDATTKANAAKTAAIADAAAKDAVLKQQAATDAQAKADAAKNAAIAEANRINTATQVTVTALQQTVSNNQSATATELAGMKATAGRHTTEINSIKTAKANKTEVSNLAKTGLQSVWQADAQAKANDAVNALHIGGRNWLVNTGQPNNSNRAAVIGAVPEVVNGRLSFAGNQTTVTKNANATTVYYRFCRPTHTNLFAFVAGTTYTFSAWVKTVHITNLRLFVQYSENNQWRTLANKSHSAMADFTRIEVTFTLPATASGAFVGIESNHVQEGALFVFHSAKLEIGNKVTDWTPAPEDIEAAISTVSASLESFKTTQTSKDTAQTAEINTAKSQIATHTADINTLKTTKADSSQVVSMARTGLQAEWRGYTDTAKTAAIADAAAKDTVVKRDAATDAQTKATAAKDAAIAEARKLDTATNAKVTVLQKTVADNQSAMAQNVTTIQTTLDSHKTSIQTSAQSIDGLKGQYTVKVDNNGYVSGFGLASEPKNGTPHSKFIVHADQFGIGATGKSTAYPFTIDTATNRVGINGALVVNGKAIIDSLVAGAITGDKIKASSINGSHIAAGAITAREIAANTITARELTSNSILGQHIAASQTIQSPVINAGTINGTTVNSGVFNGGSINIGNGNFVVDGSGNLTAKSGRFEGTVYANKIEGDILKSYQFTDTEIQYELSILPLPMPALLNFISLSVTDAPPTRKRSVPEGKRIEIFLNGNRVFRRDIVAPKIGQTSDGSGLYDVFIAESQNITPSIHLPAHVHHSIIVRIRPSTGNNVRKANYPIVCFVGRA